MGMFVLPSIKVYPIRYQTIKEEEDEEEKEKVKDMKLILWANS